jgi:hypothetical protein
MWAAACLKHLVKDYYKWDFGTRHKPTYVRTLKNTDHKRLIKMWTKQHRWGSEHRTRKEIRKTSPYLTSFDYFDDSTPTGAYASDARKTVDNAPLRKRMTKDKPLLQVMNDAAAAAAARSGVGKKTENLTPESET